MVVVGDELMVKIGKAEEGSYVLNFGRSQPDGNIIEFD